MEQELKIAVAQSPGSLSGPEERLNWLSDQLVKLADEELDLLVLPELFLTGYNVGEKLIDWAEKKDGPSARAIADLARKYNLAIHYGFTERVDHTDAVWEVFNAAQCIGPDGVQISIHRKLILPPGFEGDHFAAGRGCDVFEFKGIKVATLICYDAEFPETFRHVAGLGAQLVLVPTALGAQWPVVARKVIPTRAFENGVYVAYANQSDREGDVSYLGESCVIAPNGEELARAGGDEEILITTVRSSQVVAAQERLPYLSDRKRLQF